MLEVSEREERARNLTRKAKLVGEILHRERIAQGLSLTEVADQAEVHRDTIKKMEKGEVVTRWTTLMDLIWVLDLSEAACLELFRVDMSTRRAAA
ncbi:hypothetical protein Gbth_017_147 [Gluconobacter thailandicus F149-1 = NBRC 100600]|uniref:HTH cro/C1-type domain-containing protein n=1 Tax=Gluconobacter thailandicus NBRC 3257 TaxID=1381097 RepID=A0ABQ0IW53_GLUTH|nr:helix-turn-helix domain-containing protein [Gluconobacter thailandicus]KXV54173.1 hypothetical protein AD946_04375 [Gluconobacter thailandicus]GAD26435.1 hypothetical protein NBRC3257_1434 [Gluconobacter thailandicus NBRC 3257]GAN92972.1 hypothetical protein Gbth_017_147 [Gluconobacter thailandicus F149-1 = NBRC 100600]GBR61584.1 hypothetical protein AA100600_2922 [Gluconobacter thailandicus F149-1 = NBRC 100600]GEL87479.1 hypothetical protein GTH01_18370 [Gluconobacter thailandicus F149-1 